MPTHYKGNAEEELALNMFIALARGTEAFFARLHSVLSAADLTPSQFGVLETLYHLGPLTASQIADKHLRSRNNLSVVIRNLEREGLVARRLCPNDRRAHWIELTDLGSRKISAVFPGFVENLVRECSSLNTHEQTELRRLMKLLGGSRIAQTADPSTE